MGDSRPVKSLMHAGPVLDVCWNASGDQLYSAGCDNVVIAQDLNSGQQMNVAHHQAPIRKIKYVKEFPGLVTASWDKTLCAWDCRTPNPVYTVQLPERAYAMDCTYPLLVVATAERKVCIFDIRGNAQKIWKTIDSPLKFQTRCVATFPGANGYALGSVEGRVAIQYTSPQDLPRNFAFKCHRVKKTQVYAVNSIAFHPTLGTFATAGSDGTFHFWDKDSKQRLKGFKRMPLPITSCAFNGNGSIFAYATSYDWSKGANGYNQSAQNAIYLHPVQESELRARPGGIH